jgi:hypothetical protein
MQLGARPPATTPTRSRASAISSYRLSRLEASLSGISMSFEPKLATRFESFWPPGELELDSTIQNYRISRPRIVLSGMAQVRSRSPRR